MLTITATLPEGQALIDGYDTTSFHNEQSGGDGERTSEGKKKKKWRRERGMRGRRRVQFSCHPEAPSVNNQCYIFGTAAAAKAVLLSEASR